MEWHWTIVTFEDYWSNDNGIRHENYVLLSNYYHFGCFRSWTLVWASDCIFFALYVHLCVMWIETFKANDYKFFSDFRAHLCNADGCKRQHDRIENIIVIMWFKFKFTVTVESTLWIGIWSEMNGRNQGEGGNMPILAMWIHVYFEIKKNPLTGLSNR